MKRSKMHLCYFHANVVFFGWAQIVYLAPVYALFLFRLPYRFAKAKYKCVPSADVTRSPLVLEALTLGSRHHRRTDPPSMIAFREEWQDTTAETIIVAEQRDKKIPDHIDILPQEVIVLPNPVIPASLVASTITPAHDGSLPRITP